MVFCPESDSILFVGSPFLDGLDGLTGRGLFISDIPLHDATRDVILVGEQARAQVSPAPCFLIHGREIKGCLIPLLAPSTLVTMQLKIQFISAETCLRENTPAQTQEVII